MLASIYHLRIHINKREKKSSKTMLIFLFVLDSLIMKFYNEIIYDIKCNLLCANYEFYLKDRQTDIYVNCVRKLFPIGLFSYDSLK